jgi:hypothetical protein
LHRQYSQKDLKNHNKNSKPCPYTKYAEKPKVEKMKLGMDAPEGRNYVHAPTIQASEFNHQHSPSL